MRFLRSVQNQNFIDIEIILIDDCSEDSSVKVIEKSQEKWPKNNLIFPDPDDMISKNIINFCYNFIRFYNYEMIRFNI